MVLGMTVTVTNPFNSSISFRICRRRFSRFVIKNCNWFGIVEFGVIVFVDIEGRDVFVEGINFGLVVVLFVIITEVVAIVTGRIVEVSGKLVIGNEVVVVVTGAVVLVSGVVVIIF